MGKIKFAAGLAVAALVATGAALFLTQTSSGKKVVKKIKADAVELGKKVAHRVAKLKTISQKKYNEVVEEIVDEYAKKKKVAEKTAISMKKELKDHWHQVKKELKTK
jgi:paraquat-inducible protein B